MAGRRFDAGLLNRTYVDTESSMKFIVKPTKPENANQRKITLCWKCSEYPPACGGL